jgi:hypothetical protein
MSIDQTPLDLIAKAKENKLYYEDVDPSSNEGCEFLSCDNPAILYLESFYVCKEHGFRLIQCLTEKLKIDTVKPEDIEKD